MRFKKCITFSVSYHPALERKNFLKNRLIFFTLGNGLKSVDKGNFFIQVKIYTCIQNVATTCKLFTVFFIHFAKKCARQVRKGPWYI